MAVGFEKTGKTTAFSTFSPNGEDGVLFLDLEQGYVQLKLSLSKSIHLTHLTMTTVTSSFLLTED
jgi:hypothetical protein